MKAKIDTKEPTLAARLAEAERAVAAADALEPGSEFAPVDEAAGLALLDFAEALNEHLEHREISVADVDVLRVLDAWLSDTPIDWIVSRMVAFATSVRAAWPAAWNHVRGPLARARVEAAARNWSARVAQNPGGLADEWLEEYARGIADLAVDDPLLGQAARLRVDELPRLQARFSEIRRRHLDHAAAEVARVEHERRDADQAAGRAHAARVDRLLRILDADPVRLRIVGNRAYRGAQLADVLRQRAVYDDATGDLVPPSARPSIEAIEATVQAGVQL